MESAISTRQRPGPIRLAALRGRPAASWALIGLALMSVAALVGYFAFPTYPTYDSFYALLWGRDLLHLHLPDFHVYRGPTEHPLAIAFGMVCSVFGDGGARLMVLGSIASFVAAVAGLYRLGELCYGPIVGLLAALLLLSRFFVENLAAQGYLDISYVALIVWAVALEVQRPRRGTSVFVLLAAAGLLRPDAWVLSGVYWLWCLPGTSTRTRLVRLALAASAPLIWVALDAVVTGNPLYSLTATAGLAAELERTHGLSSVVASMWTFSNRIDKLPVLLGALIGIPLAIWLSPRRTLIPLAAMVLLYFVFLLEGAGGASVIDRYLLGGADDAAAVLRGVPRGLVDARAGHGHAARVDRRRRGALDLRRRLGGHDREPVLAAQHARLPRGIPRRPGDRAARPEGRRRAAPLPAAVAAQQQADPRRALDPRQRRPARHRRAQPGARGRRQGLARARGPDQAAAASRSTRSAARSSSRRSSTSATTRATRSP